MNEIILAPCDVITKIKQNSSDMNEIILSPCDAGYVQSCTGLFIVSVYKQLYKLVVTLVVVAVVVVEITENFVINGVQL
jgi:hypothetical protein